MPALEREREEGYLDLPLNSLLLILLIPLLEERVVLLKILHSMLMLRISHALLRLICPFLLNHIFRVHELLPHLADGSATEVSPLFGRLMPS